MKCFCLVNCHQPLHTYIPLYILFFIYTPYIFYVTFLQCHQYSFFYGLSKSLPAFTHSCFINLFCLSFIIHSLIVHKQVRPSENVLPHSHRDILASMFFMFFMNLHYWFGQLIWLLQYQHILWIGSSKAVIFLSGFAAVLQYSMHLVRHNMYIS